MNESECSEIYVALLNEGTTCWRPVQARPLGDDLYEILSEKPDPELEEWEFSTGDIVRCERKVFSGGEVGLVAVEKRLA
jgi:hypothetical protein